MKSLTGIAVGAGVPTRTGTTGRGAGGDAGVLTDCCEVLFEFVVVNKPSWSETENMKGLGFPCSSPIAVISSSSSFPSRDFSGFDSGVFLRCYQRDDSSRLLQLGTWCRCFSSLSPISSK